MYCVWDLYSMPAKKHSHHHREKDTLSRLLSKVLRHDAIKMGLAMGKDGGVSVNDLLAHQLFRAYTAVDIEAVVAENDKKRFQLGEGRRGQMMIRAAQGHTIDIVDDSALLTEILDASEVPVCIHGTYHAFLPSILEHGLSRMKRNHIHMATGMPNGDEVISGMRSSCQVVLHVDVAAAMAAGIKFYRSSNGVILSPGADGGVLPAKFLRVVHT